MTRSTSDASDEAAVRDMLRAERLGLCDRLEELDAAEWSSASACTGWSVHEVVAHLTLATRQSKLDFVRGMLRHRGDFDRMTAAQAVAHAQEYGPAELIEQLRESAASTRTGMGSSARDSLIDVIVHGQDIARPLGVRWVTPPERVVVALDHALASRWYGAKKRFARAALEATDVDWTGGHGTLTIRGAAIDLLLAATGRTIGVDRLSGAGTVALQAAVNA
ncbi:hypothetical protein YM304_25570 [Ilumatobacter coccineus YM16-304]|uniref:Mycothiol-dependent maleylpyruvate isomerase metal-binding domain-containing protein n=2 Tax=Ilumatobacter coccineus TaxID=467094 RepID=A0A6C7E8T2_ILUCY|nr:hypothetical protein YM304_25570 [Ilumatobacter coccineus YM16-304]